MPTKHIDEATWLEIEALTVKTIRKIGKTIKTSDMLHAVLDRGLSNLDASEVEAWFSEHGQSGREAASAPDTPTQGATRR